MKRVILILVFLSFFVSCDKVPLEVCVTCTDQWGFSDSYCADPVAVEMYKRELEKIGWTCKYD